MRSAKPPISRSWILVEVMALLVIFGRSLYGLCYFPPGRDEIRRFGALLEKGWSAVSLSDPSTHPVGSWLGLISMRFLGDEPWVVSLPAIPFTFLYLLLLRKLLFSPKRPELYVVALFHLAANPAFLVWTYSIKGYMLSMILVVALFLLVRRFENGTWKKEDHFVFLSIILSSIFIHTVVTFAVACMVLSGVIWTLHRKNQLPRKIFVEGRSILTFFALGILVCTKIFTLHVQTILGRDTGPVEGRFSLQHLAVGLFGLDGPVEIALLMVMLAATVYVTFRYAPDFFSSIHSFFLISLFGGITAAYYGFKMNYMGGRFFIWLAPLVAAYCFFLSERLPTSSLRRLYRFSILLVFCILPWGTDPKFPNLASRSFPDARAFVSAVRKQSGTIPGHCFLFTGSDTFARSMGWLDFYRKKKEMGPCRNRFLVALTEDPVFNSNYAALPAGFRYDVLLRDSLHNGWYLVTPLERATAAQSE